jgi:hypothetical protein
LSDDHFKIFFLLHTDVAETMANPSTMLALTENAARQKFQTARAWRAEGPPSKVDKPQTEPPIS